MNHIPDPTVTTVRMGAIEVQRPSIFSNSRSDIGEEHSHIIGRRLPCKIYRLPEWQNDLNNPAAPARISAKELLKQEGPNVRISWTGAFSRSTNHRPWSVVEINRPEFIY